MAEVVKLAQSGQSALEAGDQDLIFSSEWPLLKIYRQGSYQANGSPANDIISTHDLGFVPVFWIFSNNIMNNFLSAGSTGALPMQVTYRSEFNGPTKFRPSMDKKNFNFITDNTFTPPVQFYYYIYALDLEKPYTAPSINLGKQPKGTPPPSVFKIAKSGSPANSSNLEDFVVHSRGRSPLVHAVYPHTADADSSFLNGAGFRFDHNLGYIPMFFLYANTGANDTSPNRWVLLNLLGFSSHADEKTITVDTNNPGLQMSLVVLKDPFFIDYNVEVNL